MLWGCESTGTLSHHLWEFKMVQLLWERIWQFLTKLNMLLLHDIAIVFLGIYPKTVENISTQKSAHGCHRSFIHMEYWTMEYYSALKNDLLSHEKTCRNHKFTLVSKRSQLGKAIYFMISVTWCPGKGKTRETIKRSVIVCGWVGGWWWIGSWTERVFRAMKILCMIP